MQLRKAHRSRATNPASFLTWTTIRKRTSSASSASTQANRLMSSEVNVWFWDVRFFKPLQKEEFRVRVDPAGRIVGFEHMLDEAAPGARLERAEALARAQAFLRDTLHTPLETYTLLAGRSQFHRASQPHRLELHLGAHWLSRQGCAVPVERRDSQATASAGYQEFLKVPEAWQRSYARLRSSNDFIEEIAIIPYALLLGAALSVMLALGPARTGSLERRAQARAVHHALYFVMQMDQWPLTRASYDTNGSYSSFVLGQIGVGDCDELFCSRCSWSSPSCLASRCIARASPTGCVSAPRSVCPDCAPSSFFAPA